jgi:hypothetical protein
MSPAPRRTARSPAAGRTVPPAASLMATPIQALGNQDSRKVSFLVYADPGMGKALRDDEPVLTHDGWVPIGSLTTEDQAVGSDGRLHNILGVYPQGRRSLYRVTFADGAEIVCDGDHLWNVKKVLTRPWVTKTTNELAQLVTPEQERGYFIPDLAPVEMPEADLPLDPYTLGVLIGNGGLSRGTPMVTIDKETISKLKLPGGVSPRLLQVESADGVVATYSLSAGPGAGRNSLMQTIREIGLNVKSRLKHVPSEYMRGSVAQRRELLAGLLDTDGTSQGCTVTFDSTSEQLVESVRELALSLGEESGRVCTHDLVVNNEPYHAWRVNLGFAQCPFRLTRKANKWKSRERVGRRRRTIVAVDPYGHGDATCIRVDSSDNLFVTRDYILTHNTKNFAGASGKLGRTLIIRPPVDHTDSIRDTANIDEWVVRSWSDMDDALIYCRTEGARKYDWVWLDSVSLWFDQGLDDIWEETLRRKPERKTFGLDRPEYGVNMERTGQWVRHMVGCPDWHFGMTAHASLRESTENKNDPQPKLMPYIQGKNMPAKLCGYMNVVGYYHLAEVGRGKQLTRVLDLNQTDEFYAKDQFDASENGRIVNPDIVKYISGTKFAPVTKTTTTKRAPKRAVRK